MNRRFLLTAIFTLGVLTFLAVVRFRPVQSSQAAPADTAREDKAREYLKRAQAALATSELADESIPMICVTQAAVGDLLGAMQTTGKIREKSLKGPVLAQIARMEFQRGDKPKAMQILHDAVAGLDSSSQEGQLVVIGTVAAQIGDFDSARQIAAKVPPSREAGQAKILLAIAAAQAKAGDLPASKQTMADAKAAWKLGQFSANNGMPSMPSKFPSDLVVAQFLADDLAGARQTVNEIVLPIEKVWAYAALGNEAAKKGDRVVATESLEMGRKTVHDNHDERDVARLQLIAEGFAKLGDQGSARAILRDARKAADSMYGGETETRANTLAVIALAQRLTGDNVAAAETFKAARDASGIIRDREAQVRALWSIAVSQALGGDIPGAQESLDSVLKVSTHFDGSILVFANSMTRIGGPGVDLSWIEKLKTPEEKGFAYLGAAMGLVVPSEGGI